MVAKSLDEKARDVLNASGFVFQLAVEHEVWRGSERHEWRVRDEEHPYTTPTMSGHIDLILKKGAMLLIVECKRTREGIWAFIAGRGADRRHARWLHVESRNGIGIGGGVKGHAAPLPHHRAYGSVHGGSES